MLRSVLCCIDSEWACSISLYLRITTCPYFLEFGLHKHWILLFIFFSKRFERRKERTQLHTHIDSDLRENRQTFYMWRKDSTQPCSLISHLSKRENKIKIIKTKMNGREKKHNYHSRIVWKKTLRKPLPTWGTSACDTSMFMNDLFISSSYSFISNNADSVSLACCSSPFNK